MGDKAAARSHLAEARKIKLPNIHKSDLAVIDITRASALELPGQLDDCLRLLRRALEASRELGDLRNQVICLNEMGRACRESGRPDAALGPHRSALDLARHIGTAIEEVQSLLLLGMAERLLGRRPAAVGHLGAALEQAKRAHLPVEGAQAAAELERAEAAVSPGG